MQIKKIKRLAFIIIILWVLILLVGLIFSKSFQGKIIESLTNQAEKHILTEIHIRKNDIHFSLFKKFPMASVELRNVVVKTPKDINLASINPPHADTLLYAKNLFLQLNLKSLLNKKYEVQKITVNQGYIQILNDNKGFSSLNIFKKSDDANEFSTNINSFSLTNVEVINQSATSKSLSRVFIKKGNASGSFSHSDFNLTLKANGQIKEIKTRKDRYLPYQNFAVDMALKRHENSYAISKGYVSISNIPMKIVGSLVIDEQTYIDVVLSSNKASLKQLDESILHKFMGESDFQPKGGNLSLQTSIKGYINKSTPAINSLFTISNGKIIDKQHNQTYNNIFVKGQLTNGKTQQLKRPMTVQLDTFYVKAGNSTQWGRLTFTDLKQPHMSGRVSGIIDASDVKSYLQTEKINFFEGSIQNTIQISGRLPKENEQISFKLKGAAVLNNVAFNLPSFNPDMIRARGEIVIHNQHSFTLDSLRCQIKNSDLTFNGQLKNVNLSQKEPHFSGDISANNIFVDDFMPPKQNNTQAAKEFIFPDSLSLSSTIKVQHFVLDNFKPQDISARINYSNKKLNVQQITMQTFSGKVLGNVSISQDANKDIQLNTNLKLQKINLEQMFVGFNNFNQTIISGEHLKGQLSGDINYGSRWNKYLVSDKASILAQGNILLENGELKNYDPIMGLSRFIEVEELKHIRFDNLSTSLTIKNRQLTLSQTHIASSAITFDGSGVHDFDNKYSYRLQVGLSDILWKKARKKKSDINEFGYIVDDGNKRTTVPFIISGKGSTFDVKYDKRTSRKSFKQKVEEEKTVLQQLFNDENTNNNSDTDHNLRIEEPEEEVKEQTEEKPVLKKTDSGTYQHKTNEFILEWDDSEDEDNEDPE